MYTSGTPVRVADERDETTLRELLEAYHTWNAAVIDEAFGETYERRAVLTADVETIGQGDRGHVWFLAEKGVDPAGCLLLSRVDETMAELKRVYVRPRYRGDGIGRALVETAIETATDHGDESVCLSTGPHSNEAHALYEALGFVAIPPYADVEVPERFHDHWKFLGLELGESE